VDGEAVMANNYQASFNTGEITPRLGGRVDLNKYGSALETCLNALPQPHGGVTRRPGTQFIAQTSVQLAGELVRLIPFQYSSDQAYIIEAGHKYFRYYMDGGQIQTFPATTKLCIHGDGKNASRDITDATGNFTITVNGDAKIDTYHKQFGSGSVYFDGVGDYLSMSDPTDLFYCGLLAWTIDFWWKPEALGTETYGFFSQWVDADNFVAGYYDPADGGRLNFAIMHVTTVEVFAYCKAMDAKLTVGEWHHVVFQVSDFTHVYMAVDGKFQLMFDNSLTHEWPNFAADFDIGRIRTTGGVTKYCKGWIDEFTFSPGIDRFTDTYTPPTTAYPLSTDSTPVTTTTPYTEDQLALIKYCQSADYLYLTHPDVRPATLTRTSHILWNYASMVFAWPPFAAENVTSIDLDPNASAVGAVAVVASQSLFTVNWVGDDIKFASGYFNIASIQNVTQATGNIISTLANHTSTIEWARCAWNVDYGFPACVMFFEERLGFAATEAQPQTLWLSESGNYINFKDKVGSTITDTDSCTYTISSDQVNVIRWMSPTKKLVLGTIGGEWMVSGNNDDGITPSNVKVREETPYGSEDMMPVRIGNSIMFVQRGGKKVREFAYTFQTDAYSSNDLIILAEHLTRNNPIKGVVFQPRPNQVLWCWLTDGTMIALTWLKEHEVIGWSRQDVGGFVESMAVIPGETEDEVWMVVKRTINSKVVRYIERLKESWSGEDVADAFYVDCGLSYAGANVTTVGGLSHLEGQAVAIHADGITLAASTVSGGSLVLGTSAAKVHVGKAITTDIKTLRCGPVEVQGKIKRIASVVLRFFETCGNVLMGSSATDADTRDLGDTPITKDEPFMSPTGYDGDGQVFIRKSDTQPMTILAINPKLESYDEINGI
jgi:hypothetical protein